MYASYEAALSNAFAQPVGRMKAQMASLIRGYTGGRDASGMTADEWLAQHGMTKRLLMDGMPGWMGMWLRAEYGDHMEARFAAQCIAVKIAPDSPHPDFGSDMVLQLLGRVAGTRKVAAWSAVLGVKRRRLWYVRRKIFGAGEEERAKTRAVALTLLLDAGLIPARD